MTLDLVTIGRANMDLYARDIGLDFADVPSGFDAMVGGSPTNIAIGTARLGMRSAALTAVGDDPIGEYVRAFLEREGVVTDYLPVKPQGKTSLAILAVIPPDRFPLVFYRDNAADLYIDEADVDALPLTETRAMLLSGNAFSRGPVRDASFHAADRARELGLVSFLDLDLRPAEWPSLDAYADTLRPVLAGVDVAIGTEEEFGAALGLDATDPELAATAAAASGGAVVLKRGPAGVSVIDDGAVIEVAGFPVEVVNTVGAGDSFASGLIARRLSGDGWEAAARYGNACGAICVTRHGCSLAMPTPAEVASFLEERS